MKKILASSLVLAAAALTVSTAVSAYSDIASLTAKDPEVIANPENSSVYQSVYQRINNEQATSGMNSSQSSSFQAENEKGKAGVADYNKAQTDAIKEDAAKNGRTIDPSVDLEKQVDQVRANSADYNNIKGSTYSSSSSEESSSDKGSKESKSTAAAVNEAKKAAKAAAKEGQKVLPNTAAVK